MLQWKTRLGFTYKALRNRPEVLTYFLSFFWKNTVCRRSYSRNNKFNALPSVVTLAVTDYCNLNYKMCPFQHSDIEKSHLDLTLIRKLIDQIHTFKPYISLCGRGEPFLHPEFFENMYPHDDVEMCDGLYPMDNQNDSDFLKTWENNNFRESRKMLKKMEGFPICSTYCRYYHYS